MLMLTFDSDTATWRSAELTLQLWERAQGVGPLFPVYAPIALTGPILRNGQLERDARQLLVYQARWLRSIFPAASPHLRFAMPSDFGRRTAVLWYCPEYDEHFIGASVQGPYPINPHEVV